MNEIPELKDDSTIVVDGVVTTYAELKKRVQDEQEFVKARCPGTKTIETVNKK
jgi:hypothetical protein